MAYLRNRNTLYVFSTVLYLTLSQVAARDYETIGLVPLYVPVYNPKIPFLGELSENLSIGKAIRVEGFVPKTVKEFQINLCDNCENGDFMLHFSVRFFENTVVRSTYNGGMWTNEERDGPFPFAVGQKFDVLIECKSEGYFVSVDGKFAFKFAHRLPYNKVKWIEIASGSLQLWRVEYTDELREHGIYGDVKNGLSLDIKGSPSDKFEKVTMDLRCHCVPRVARQKP